MYERMAALQALFAAKIGNTEHIQSIEETRLSLIQLLNMQERRMLMEIVDGKDQLCEKQNLLHFMAGFCLAAELHQEMNDYRRQEADSTYLRETLD